MPNKKLTPSVMNNDRERVSNYIARYNDNALSRP